MQDIPVALFNFGLILALVPVCQGIVQMLKSDAFHTYITRLLTLSVGLGLVFLVRASGVQGVSELVNNPYLASMTGLVVAIMSAGFYDTMKSSIVKQIAKSESNVTVPSELVGGDKTDPKAETSDTTEHFKTKGVPDDLPSSKLKPEPEE